MQNLKKSYHIEIGIVKTKFMGKESTVVVGKNKVLSDTWKKEKQKSFCFEFCPGDTSRGVFGIWQDVSLGYMVKYWSHGTKYRNYHMAFKFSPVAKALSI